jgi:hypothetical protein
VESVRNDPHSKQVTFDASKRDRDERLNRLNREFASPSEDGGRKPKGSSLRQASKYDDDDDDDDIVAMMDKMNRK